MTCRTSNQVIKAGVGTTLELSHALELSRKFCIPVIRAPLELALLGPPLMPEEVGFLLFVFLYCAGAFGLTKVCTLQHYNGMRTTFGNHDDVWDMETA